MPATKKASAKSRSATKKPAAKKATPPKAPIAAVQDTEPTPVEPANDTGAVSDRPKLDLSKMTSAGRFRGGTHFYAGQLKPLGNNWRDWNDPDNLEAIEQFAATIIEGMKDGTGGIHKPIEYIPGDYYEGDLVPVDDGETRLRAVWYLEGREYVPGRFVEQRIEPDTLPIPAIPIAANRNDKARMIDRVVKNLGRPFKDVELARWMAAMKAAYKMTEDQIADAIGKPNGQSYVSQILALNNAPVSVQTFVSQGYLSPTTVVGVMRDHGDKAEQILTDAVEEKIRIAGSNAYGDNVLDIPTPAMMSARGGKRVRASRIRSSMRVTRREIQQRTGDVDKAAYNRTNFAILLQAVKEQARTSPSEQTRNDMNDVLKRIGLEPLSVSVEAEQNAPTPADVIAA